jgi:hypothetical protein
LNDLCSSARPRQAAEMLSVCSTTLRFFRCDVRELDWTQKKARRLSSQSGQHTASSSTDYAIEDSNLRMTCVSSSHSQRAHSPSGEHCAPRKSTISRRLRGVQLSV